MVMAVWSVLCCTLLAGAGLRIYRNASALRVLAACHPPTPAAWPTLSVLVPACNEADTLAPAMASLLAQDYPGVEVILVDDRSTDGTGAVVDRIAAGDRRVIPVHVTALPDGWLGKVHALARAREKASGDWLLFTDADVHFAPGVLKQAVAFALAEGAGHVAILPDVPVRGFWLRLAIAAFSQSFFLVFDRRTIGVPGSGVMMGVGAFNLVRAADLDASPGFDHLRLEVIDDVGVAQMLNRGGVRGVMAGGQALVSVDWYPTFGAMVRGLEKGAFAALGFSPWRVTALASGSLAVLIGLLLAPHSLPGPWGAGGLALAYGVYVVGGIAGFRKLGAPWWMAVLAPIGSAINIWITIRSAWMTSRRGGVAWRGTVYPLAALRAGQRIAF
jgi:hypothetical protein